MGVVQDYTSRSPANSREDSSPRGETFMCQACEQSPGSLCVCHGTGPGVKDLVFPQHKLCTIGVAMKDLGVDDLGARARAPLIPNSRTEIQNPELTGG